MKAFLRQLGAAICMAVVSASAFAAAPPRPGETLPPALTAIADGTPDALAARYKAQYPDLYMGGLTKLQGGGGRVDKATPVAWIDTCAPEFGLSQVLVFTGEGPGAAVPLVSPSCVETVTLTDVTRDGRREMAVVQVAGSDPTESVYYTTYLFWRDGHYQAPVTFTTFETSATHALKEPDGGRAAYPVVRDVHGVLRFRDTDGDGFRETILFDKYLALSPGDRPAPAWAAKALADAGWGWGKLRKVEAETWTFDAKAGTYLLTRRALVTDRLPALTP